jgi:hypothetical protein
MRQILSRVSRRGALGLAGIASTLACACGRAIAQSAPQTEPVPGPPPSTKSRILGLGADALQSHAPINSIDMYLNGFHFYADDMGRQIEAHHFCHHVSEDFFQCVIYDGDKADSRLIGVEYIVSERVFKSLPDDEKRLWHSHRYETTSGQLVAPGIPEAVEHSAIAMLVNTYGKTWHTWQIDQNSALPLGAPQLMMGFTQDGQLDPNKLQNRNAALGVSKDDRRASRDDLAKSAHEVANGADSWRSGQVPQLALSMTPVKNARG